MAENIITNLTDKELAVIQATDSLGSATIIQIAKAAGIKRTTVYNFIDDLVDCNLLSMKIINGVRHYNSIQQSVTMLEATPKGFKDKYNSLQFFSSVAAIRKEFQSFLSGPHFSLHIGSPEKYKLLGDKFMDQYLQKAAQAPTNAHIMYSPQISYFHNNNKYGESGIIMRSFDCLPSKNLFIVSCDRVLFSSTNHHDSAYLIKDQELVDFFNFGFYRVWDQ